MAAHLPFLRRPLPAAPRPPSPSPFDAETMCGITIPNTITKPKAGSK